MGTTVSFDVRLDHRDETSTAAAQTAIADAVSWLHHVDALFSTYRADSQISRLGRGELRLADCDADVAGVLDLCSQASRDTRGYFSATYGGRLDPTGLVKGWSIQRASELLRERAFLRHAINGGGDVAACGEPEPGRPWQVGVAHPLHAGAVADVVAVRDGAVATSGIAERGLHVLDPFTGQPATALASVTVVGPDLTRADAYATAALAMGHAAHAWLDDLAGFEAFAIAADGTGWRTAGFDALSALRPAD